MTEFGALHDFMSQLVRHSPVCEKYGEHVAPKVFFTSHKDENILGVFWYYVPDAKLIYSEEYKDHAAFPEYAEISALPGMLYRGRVVKHGELTVIMIYTVGDKEKDPSQLVLADILHKIVKKTGLPIDYVVDDSGRSLMESVLAS